MLKRKKSTTKKEQNIFKNGEKYEEKRIKKNSHNKIFKNI